MLLPIYAEKRMLRGARSGTAELWQIKGPEDNAERHGPGSRGLLSRAGAHRSGRNCP